MAKQTVASLAKELTSLQEVTVRMSELISELNGKIFELEGRVVMNTNSVGNLKAEGKTLNQRQSNIFKENAKIKEDMGRIVGTVYGEPTTNKYRVCAEVRTPNGTPQKAYYSNRGVATTEAKNAFVGTKKQVEDFLKKHNLKKHGVCYLEQLA